MTQTTCNAASIDDIKSFVLGNDRIIPTGAAESPDANLSISQLNKVVEYQPDEYTITLEAGATVSQAKEALVESDQYLPFDPSFADAGATIGGMVASGASGPGSTRYGVMRDFVLGIAYVDGLGNHVHTGGKVVKNAAGLDMPKFLIGSQGSYGIFTRVCLKVFPAPQNYRTIRFDFDSANAAFAAMARLNLSKLQLDGAELTTANQLLLRLSGTDKALAKRLPTLPSILGKEASKVSEENEAAIWTTLREFEDLDEDGCLIKIPLALSKAAKLNDALQKLDCQYRFSLNGATCWVKATDYQAVSKILCNLSLSGQVVSGLNQNTLIGYCGAANFIRKIKSALDPENKFRALV